MGPRQVERGALFYNFSLAAHVPADHLLRSIDRFVDLSDLRRELAPFYSMLGRPSTDPELMIRMLIVGYCFGIRSERRLCEEVHLNLAYRARLSDRLILSVLSSTRLPRNRAFGEPTGKSCRPKSFWDCASRPVWKRRQCKPCRSHRSRIRLLKRRGFVGIARRTA